MQIIHVAEPEGQERRNAPQAELDARADEDRQNHKQPEAGAREPAELHRGRDQHDRRKYDVRRVAGREALRHDVVQRVDRPHEIEIHLAAEHEVAHFPERLQKGVRQRVGEQLQRENHEHLPQAEAREVRKREHHQPDDAKLRSKLDDLRDVAQKRAEAHVADLGLPAHADQRQPERNVPFDRFHTLSPPAPSACKRSSATGPPAKSRAPRSRTPECRAPQSSRGCRGCRGRSRPAGNRPPETAAPSRSHAASPGKTRAGRTRLKAAHRRGP